MAGTTNPNGHFPHHTEGKTCQALCPQIQYHPVASGTGQAPNIVYLVDLPSWGGVVFISMVSLQMVTLPTPIVDFRVCLASTQLVQLEKGTSVSRARVVTFCANVVLAHGDEHHAGGKGGQKELKGLMQPLSPADSCLLQPSSLHIDCLAVASESANLRKWYRPNFQAGRYKMSAYPKSF